METPTVRFQGDEFVFIGKDDHSEGAIAKLEDYEAGICSYAHLFSDGVIRRFGQEIGTAGDLEWLGSVNSSPDPTRIINILTHPSWEGREG